MARTIGDAPRASKRKGSRGRGLAAVLLLLLLGLFWKFVGGAGGWWPESGGRTAKPDAPQDVRDASTARRNVMAPFVPPPPPPPPPLPAGGRPSARVQVAPSGAGVKVQLAALGPGTSKIEVRPAGRGAAPRSYEVRDGEATIPDVAPGTSLRVRVDREGAPPLIGDVVANNGAEVELEDAATIRAVLVYPDGAAAGDLEIAVRLSRAHADTESLSIRTGADGSLAFETRSGHDLLLEIRPGGAAPGDDVSAVVEQRAALEPGATWDLGTVPFEREVVLAEGAVEDANGAVHEGATVFALPLARPNRAFSARSGAGGRFVVRGPPDAGAFELFASTEDRAARGPEPLAPGASGVRLRLLPAGALRGQVALPAPPFASLVRVELRTVAGNPYATAFVREGGAFEFSHVPAGRYAILVHAPDRTAPPVADIDVAAGALCADPRLERLAVETALRLASLRVLDGSGAPLAGARVEVAVTDAHPLRAVTDATGTAAVVMRASTSVPVTVALRGYEPARVDWDGAAPVTLKPR